MGTIGNFDYPDWGIEYCISVARVMDERFSGKVENQATLAEVLGHKTLRSGGYISKITALRRYGLVSGRGDLTITELARTILYPKSSEERASAITQAMENIELFKRIFDRLGEKPATDDFWVDLVEITGAERNIAQKDATKIRNLYMEGQRYLVESRKAESREGRAEALVAAPVSKIPADTLFEIRTKDYGTLVVKDEESISLARALVDLIEKKLKSKKEVKSENQQ